MLLLVKGCLMQTCLLCVASHPPPAREPPLIGHGHLGSAEAASAPAADHGSATDLEWDDAGGDDGYTDHADRVADGLATLGLEDGLAPAALVSISDQGGALAAVGAEIQSSWEVRFSPLLQSMPAAVHAPQLELAACFA
jgi:hypothetical protein